MLLCQIMTLRERIALVACIVVHIYVLWNVYEFSKLTPRIINIVTCG